MILQLKSVFKNYYRGKTEVPVLKDINLEVEEGEYLAIMGPSGSGKTTLMNLIGCLDVPTSGEYILDDKKINELDDNALDNVALPLLYGGVPQKERRERAAEALKMVGLEERMNFMPNQLSGGQCQRVAIARAMVTNPKLLLADEPTGALDTAAGNQIMEIFRQLSDRGMTIIMITHEPSIAECANKTYHILDGQLITDKEVAANEA